MESALVRDWMTITPYTVTPYTMLLEAYQIMKTYEVRRLPVVDEESLVGIVTLGDIRMAVPTGSLDLLAFNQVLSHTPIARVMSRNPIAVHANDSISLAAQLMIENKIGGLPVMNDGELVGIITESDLFRLVIAEHQSESEFV